MDSRGIKQSLNDFFDTSVEYCICVAFISHFYYKDFMRIFEYLSQFYSVYTSSQTISAMASIVIL